MTTLFVGLGRMGLPMARRYAAVHDVTLHDADAAALRRAAVELGATALKDLTDLAQIDVVILMVPSSRVVEAILEGAGSPGGTGLLGRLEPGGLVIDMSSSEPDSTQRLAAAAAERGVGYVDAPVSGGVAKAVSGELSIMVGGAGADVDRAMTHLQPMAGAITRVGPSGAGHAAKALNNLLSATNIAAAAEVLAVAGRFGIDPAVMIDVVNASTGRSQASEVKYPRHILTGTYDSGFAFDLMVKDIGIATALAQTHEVPLEVTGAAAHTAREAAAHHPEDHTELARYVAARAGTDLRSRSERRTDTDTEDA
ncbi:NAD(P)-dependent oxidoreductase [Georgenia alba]|uniref:NAD(P)-dependent oxidoreductase n=1 Tax=Georgenia alba TaxID=2233858 RepID=A0ABW2QAK4_9MICO